MKKLIFVLTLTMSSLTPVWAGAINPVSVCGHQEVTAEVVEIINRGDPVFKGAEAHSITNASEVIATDRHIQCFGRANYTNGHSIWVKYTIMTNNNASFVLLDLG